MRRYHVSANPNVAWRMGLQLHPAMVDANARDLRGLLRVRAVSAIEKGCGNCRNEG